MSISTVLPVTGICQDFVRTFLLLAVRRAVPVGSWCWHLAALRLPAGAWSEVRILVGSGRVGRTGLPPRLSGDVEAGDRCLPARPIA